MAKLEILTAGPLVKSIISTGLVTVVNIGSVLIIPTSLFGHIKGPLKSSDTFTADAEAKPKLKNWLWMK
ncbi:MAG: hypothetical protein GY845_29930 [Planctomycetes bacterium]|nr:hypothetical protein [Planctomycetota bacterium]